MIPPSPLLPTFACVAFYAARTHARTPSAIRMAVHGHGPDPSGAAGPARPRAHAAHAAHTPPGGTDVDARTRGRAGHGRAPVGLGPRGLLGGAVSPGASGFRPASPPRDWRRGSLRLGLSLGALPLLLPGLESEGQATVLVAYLQGQLGSVAEAMGGHTGTPLTPACRRRCLGGGAARLAMLCPDSAGRCSARVPAALLVSSWLRTAAPSVHRGPLADCSTWTPLSGPACTRAATPPRRLFVRTVPRGFVSSQRYSSSMALLPDRLASCLSLPQLGPAQAVSARSGWARSAARAELLLATAGGVPDVVCCSTKTRGILAFASCLGRVWIGAEAEDVLNDDGDGREGSAGGVAGRGRNVKVFGTPAGRGGPF